MGYRICVLLEDDVHKKLRAYQSKFIQKNKVSISFSKTINHILNDYFGKK